MHPHVLFLYFWQLQEVPSFVCAGTELCPAMGSGREHGWFFPLWVCLCQMHLVLDLNPSQVLLWPRYCLLTSSAAGVKCSLAALYRSLWLSVPQGSSTSGLEVEPCVGGIVGSGSSGRGSGPR